MPTHMKTIVFNSTVKVKIRCILPRDGPPSHKLPRSLSITLHLIRAPTSRPYWTFLKTGNPYRLLLLLVTVLAESLLLWKPTR